MTRTTVKTNGLARRWLVPRQLTAGASAIISEELASVASTWHRQMLPRHFDQDATSRYGYEKRSRRYMIRKARAFHHQRPLEFTGESRRQLTGSARIESDDRSARAVMRGPRYWYQYRTDSQQPNKAAEVTRAMPDEIRELAEDYRRRVDARLRSAGESDVSPYDRGD